MARVAGGGKEEKGRFGAPIPFSTEKRRRSTAPAAVAQAQRPQEDAAEKGWPEKQIARPVPGVARFNRTILSNGHERVKHFLSRRRAVVESRLTPFP
jgi:hypothetical protein